MYLKVRSHLKNNYFALRQGSTRSESAVYIRVHAHRGTSTNTVLKQRDIFETTSKQKLALFGLYLFSAPLLAEPAVVATAAEGMGDSLLKNGLMLGAFAFIFYFLILRPQSKRAKQQRDLITNLQKGDEVVTTGGILGKIHRISDNFLVLMIADNVEMVVQKQAIAGSIPKGTIKNI